MKLHSLLLVSAALIGLTACAPDGANEAAATQVKPAETVVATAPKAAAVDFGAAPTGRYTADKQHAYITFTYNHKGYSHPYLHFRNFDAELDFDAGNPENSRVSVDIDINSVDTGVDEFDGHLRGDKFFNVTEHPRAVFKSTAFSLAAGGATLTGDLTMMGVTKPVTLDVTVNNVGAGGDGEAIMGLSARGKILRSDWNLGRYAPMVGDEVTLIIEAEFNLGK